MQFMADYIEEQLKASGVAQVLVVLKSPATAGRLDKHFHLAETAPQREMVLALGKRAKISRPPAVRVYEHLGLMLGMVDKKGLSALRADKKNVAQVHSAPVFSLIRPRVRLATAKPKTA